MTLDTHALWRELHDRLLGFFERRVHDRAEAEDLLHELFVRVHAERRNVRDADRVHGWIYRIAHNLVVDHHRRQARMPAKRVSTEGEPSALEEEGEPSALEELTACIEPLVDALDEPYREALRWTDLGGMTQREAAVRAGISVSGMKSRVQRGRRQLRVLLMACCTLERNHRGQISGYEVRERGCCELPSR